MAQTLAKTILTETCAFAEAFVPLFKNKPYSSFTEH